MILDIIVSSETFPNDFIQIIITSQDFSIQVQFALKSFAIKDLFVSIFVDDFVYSIILLGFVCFYSIIDLTIFDSSRFHKLF